MISSILVVDDDRFIRELVKDVLGTEGYRFSEAANGREGLIAFERDQPQLVILDLLMPELSGIETLTELRRRSPQLPVIMLSSLDNPALMAEALRAGASKFIVKPFHPLELVEAVRLVAGPATPGPR